MSFPLPPPPPFPTAEATQSGLHKLHKRMSHPGGVDGALHRGGWLRSHKLLYSVHSQSRGQKWFPFMHFSIARVIREASLINPDAHPAESVWPFLSPWLFFSSQTVLEDRNWWANSVNCLVFFFFLTLALIALDILYVEQID